MPPNLNCISAITRTESFADLRLRRSFELSTFRYAETQVVWVDAFSVQPAMC